MSHLPCSQPSEGIRDAPRLSTSIHILDDYSLINIFHLYGPRHEYTTEVDDSRLLNGGEWDCERWWYKLAHVCQRWRCLLLQSASYLQLRLVCTYGTPVSDMLLHSPPLPLIIDYLKEGHDIGAEDEKRINFALQHRNRLCRIRLLMPVPELQKFIVAINDEFPLLEFLYVGTEAKNDMSLVLSTSFRAPRLRHLVLHHFALPIGSPLLMAPVSLVTLSFLRIHPSTSFRPIDLLRRLSLMPQLETLGILFHSFVPDSDIVRELLDPSTMVHATLPNLRWFGFGGASAYLDALLPRITTPLLEKLQLRFADELIFSVSRLLPYMSTAKNLKLISADVYFDASGVDVKVYPCEGAKIYSFWLDVACEDIDFQVYSIAEVLDDLSPIFSAVEHLTLASANNNLSPDLYDEFDRSQWRKLLRSFSKVKVLLIGDELVGEVSRCLRSKEEELPLELLPELKELSYPAGREDGDRFTDLIEARQNAGRPLIVVRR